MERSGKIRSSLRKLPGIDFVEFSFHNAALASLVAMMARGFACGFHIRWRAQSDSAVEVPIPDSMTVPFVADATQDVGFASLLFYGRVLRRVWFQKILWVTTGPESRVLADLFFFSLLKIISGRKMVLCVRDTERWVTSGPDRQFQDRIRWALLRGVRRLVFETETQRSYFHKICPSYKGLTSSASVFSSDSNTIWSTNHQAKPRSASLPGKLTIGLVGGVDPLRRNYSQVYEALSEISPELRARIILLVLGSSRSPSSRRILDSLSELVEVKTFGEYLSNLQLVQEFGKCQLLLSPLRTDKGYGKTKGTGCFGDALLAERKIIIPSSVMADREFEHATLRYDSSKSLSQLLTKLVQNPVVMRMPLSVAEHYSFARMRERLIRDLDLASLVR